MPSDASLRISQKKTDLDISNIIYGKFKLGDTPASIQFTIGGVAMYPYFKYVSKNAVRKILLDSDNKKYFTEYGLSYKFTAVKKYGLYREHVIPSSFVYKLFKDKFNKGELTIEYLLKFIPKLKLALITQEEEQYLRKAKLHSKMPSEWTEDMDPLYRYEVAGLDESIWFHYWKIC